MSTTDAKRMVESMLASSQACPHCGELNLQTKPARVACRQVECINCGACGPGGSSDVDAIRRWNTRESKP